MTRKTAILAATAAIAAPAMAQSFNIDFDLPSGNYGAGAPANSFAGAAGQTGYWNAVGTVGVPVTLKGLNGVNTAATMNINASFVYHDANDGFASGEYAKLMEDTIKVASMGQSIVVTLNGLTPGKYLVYTYADDPADGNQHSRVTVDGVAQAVGGTHGTNEFFVPVTHSRHVAVATAGNPVTVTIASNSVAYPSARAVFAGLQVVPAPSRLYVNDDAPAGGDGKTWATAFQSPADAFAALTDYGGAVDEIWVAGGTYLTPQVPILGYCFDLPDGVKLYGGFAGTETSLSQRNLGATPSFLSGAVGNSGTDDNAWHVVIAWGCGYETEIDGFTIASGNADQPQNPWDGFGGGMYIRDSQLTVRNCTFVGNLGWRGGGMAIQDSTPRIEDCYFFNNTAEQSGGAIYLLAGGAPKIVGCDFRLNHATVNYGGAIANGEGNNAVVANCRFMQNDANWGGGAIFTSNGNFSVMNSIFTANSGTADRGGAIHTFGANTYLFVTNCTVVANTNYQCGGISSFSGANVFVRNSIVYGNTDQDPATGTETEQLRRSTDSAMTVNYCNVQGWSGILGGSGNFDAISQFVDSNGADNIPGTLDDNFRLLSNSPCIDRGSNAQLAGDAADVDNDNNLIEQLPIDLDGNARRIDDPNTADLGAGTAPIVDIGAYEFAPPCDLVSDLNGDGEVSIADLAILLSNFGSASGMGHDQGDLDGDTDVDISDLALLLSEFGQTCN